MSYFGARINMLLMFITRNTDKNYDRKCEEERGGKSI